jgi:hypothetical protein
MAMQFLTLKNTNQETVIHFASTAAESGTIALNTLAASTQALIVGGTPTVDIVKWSITGALGSKVTITRNSKLVIATAPENAPYLEDNAWGVPLNIENTSDIVVVNGAATEVTGILVLRKQAGWATKVENEVYGAYDDVTRVGASTTLSGSPDKV